MNSIEFHHISKSFQDRKVLSDISFSIREGEIFGLLGPSGAGKTTILNILTGRLQADSGTATLWGKRCEKPDVTTLRRVGAVLDQDGLYDRLSCYDNLLLYARLYHIPRRSIMSALECVQLQDAANKQVNQLSRGMRQRLALARAILHEPDLLFLDEPTSGLDPVTMREIHQLLRKLQSKGTTIMLTTHNMEEATVMCNTVALLFDGQIVEKGTPRDICLRNETNQAFHVLLKDGREKTFYKSGRDALAALVRDDRVQAIHTLEPNLETVFIEKTGRGLHQ